jgi:hypothetical protein
LTSFFGLLSRLLWCSLSLLVFGVLVVVLLLVVLLLAFGLCLLLVVCGFRSPLLLALLVLFRPLLPLVVSAVRVRGRGLPSLLPSVWVFLAWFFLRGAFLLVGACLPCLVLLAGSAVLWLSVQRTSSCLCFSPVRPGCGRGFLLFSVRLRSLVWLLPANFQLILL